MSKCKCSSNSVGGAVRAKLPAYARGWSRTALVNAANSGNAQVRRALASNPRGRTNRGRRTAQ